MNSVIICTAGNTAALRVAERSLCSQGFRTVDAPASDVTHLLLPVPSFQPDGLIVGGGVLEHILADLPERVTVVGGKLHHPALRGYPTIDLLENSNYIAQNAAITADRAILIAGNNLPVIFRDCPALVIGWGRIGKCLALQLQQLGARVCVAARKSADRAMAQALGMDSADPDGLKQDLGRFRVIFNTAPAMMLDEERVGYCRPDCLKIDLASQPGIAGKNVLWARALPGKDAPESSGLLIARTVADVLKGKEGAL